MYGIKISTIRLARGISQYDMATRIGLAQSEYSKIENNQRVKITDDLLLKIAAVLGVSVEDIKSPLPIVMNFCLPEKNTSLTQLQQSAFNEKIIEELSNQLHVKDVQIQQLIAMIGKKE
jgi:transcriptional regulator with XRE-family HTH domain